MFKYYKANCISDALKFAEQTGKECTFYAGGTDLMPAIRVNKIKPQNIVYIGSIAELKGLKEDGDFIRIGTLVTHASLESSYLVKIHIPSLTQACASIGGPQTRNLGTIGGNICWASPAADTVPVLMAHDARVRLLSTQNEREIPINQFYLGPNKTILQPGELLGEIIVPKPKGIWASTFTKIGRRKALSISVVNCAVFLTDRGAQASIALGSVAPFPFRALRAEAEWRKIWNTNDPGITLLVGKVAGVETQPISDNRAPAWYRKQVTEVVVERALMQCMRAIESISR